MDLVYIVKNAEANNELRYSLRSVEKFIPTANVWIVGYKPSWLTNVNYLHTEQTENKWKNSIHNIIEACKCNDISNDFILMNDDFIAIQPILNLEESINLSLGSLTDSINRHAGKSSGWHKAFTEVKNLLEELNIDTPLQDFESHTPILINKQKYLEVMNLPLVQKFMKTDKVLHKRTLYKNIAGNTMSRVLPQDVKIITDDQVAIKNVICDWISICDNQIRSAFYPNLNKFLENLFSEKSRFEINDIVLPKSTILHHKKSSFNF